MTESPAESTDLPYRRRLTFPAGLIAFYLLLQLLLLGWSAFPEATMKGAQPLESWLFLAGGQALFTSWIWPISRTGQSSRGQIVLGGVLLLAASVPAAVAAVLWSDAATAQVLAGAIYIVCWLLAGGAAAGARPIIRWGYCLVLTLANLGLVGMGYLWLDFLGTDPMPFWRLSPMCQASRLAELGWPVGSADRLAALAPVLVLLALIVLCLLPAGRISRSVPARR